MTSTNDDGFRRLEVITGVGRRRRWTDEEEVARPTTRTVELKLGSRLVLGQALAVDAGLMLEEDSAEGPGRAGLA